MVSDGPFTGYVLTYVLDQNTRAYEYGDDEWREAGAALAKADLLGQLTTDVGTEDAAGISVEVFATSVMTPFNSFTVRQSSRGYKVHMVVKGVQFDTEDASDNGLSLVKAKAIKLEAMLPNGTTDEAGMSPNRPMRSLPRSAFLCRASRASRRTARQRRASPISSTRRLPSPWRMACCLSGQVAGGRKTSADSKCATARCECAWPERKGSSVSRRARSPTPSRTAQR